MATLFNKIHEDSRYTDILQGIWLAALASGYDVNITPIDFRTNIDEGMSNILTVVTEWMQSDPFITDVAHAMRDRDYPDQVDQPFEDPALSEYKDRARKGIGAAIAGSYDPPDPNVPTDVVQS